MVWVKYHTREAPFRAGMLLDASKDSASDFGWLDKYEVAMAKHEESSSMPGSARAELLQSTCEEFKAEASDIFGDLGKVIEACDSGRRFKLCEGIVNPPGVVMALNRLVNWDGRLSPKKEDWLKSWKKPWIIDERKPTALDWISKKDGATMPLKLEDNQSWSVQDLVSEQYNGASVLSSSESTVRPRNKPCARGPETDPVGTEHGIAEEVWQKINTIITVPETGTVKLWVPGSQKDCVKLNQPNPGTEAGVNGLTAKYPAFMPSYGHHQTGFFDWGADSKTLQIVVVRAGKQYDTYKQHLGGTSCLVLKLPAKFTMVAKSVDVTASNGKIGFARLFCQALAHGLGLDWIWFVDDNVPWVKRLALEGECTAGNYQYQLQTCTMAEAMEPIEAVAALKPGAGSNSEADRAQFILGYDEGKYHSYPAGKYDELLKGLTPAGGDAAKCAVEVSGHPAAQVALIALNRDVSIWKKVPKGLQKPFSFTRSAYSMFLLNVKLTINKSVLYPPRSHWEDVDFNELAERKGLAVIKCNTIFHCKINFQKLPKLVQSITVVVHVPDKDDCKLHLDVPVDGCNTVGDLAKKIKGQMGDGSDVLRLFNDADDQLFESLKQLGDAEHENELMPDDALDTIENATVHAYAMPMMVVVIHVYGLPTPIKFSVGELNDKAVKEALEGNHCTSNSARLSFDRFQWYSAQFEAPILDIAAAIERAKGSSEMWCCGVYHFDAKFECKSTGTSQDALTSPGTQRAVLLKVLGGCSLSEDSLIFCGEEGTADNVELAFPHMEDCSGNNPFLDPMSINKPDSIVVLCGDLFSKSDAGMTLQRWTAFWKAAGIYFGFPHAKPLKAIVLVLPTASVRGALDCHAAVAVDANYASISNMTTVVCAAVPPVATEDEVEMANGSYCVVMLEPAASGEGDPASKGTPVEVNTGEGTQDTEPPSKRPRIGGDVAEAGYNLKGNSVSLLDWSGAE